MKPTEVRKLMTGLRTLRHIYRLKQDLIDNGPRWRPYGDRALLHLGHMHSERQRQQWLGALGTVGEVLHDAPDGDSKIVEAIMCMVTALWRMDVYHSGLALIKTHETDFYGRPVFFPAWEILQRRHSTLAINANLITGIDEMLNSKPKMWAQQMLLLKLST